MSMRNLNLSMKIVLISAGIVTLGVGLKLSIPIAVTEIPAIWSAILSWMKPPYLYIIINGIIITIAASSRFHHSHSESPAARTENLISVKTPPAAAFESLVAVPPYVNNAVEELPPAAAAEEEVVEPEIDDSVVELKPVVLVNGSQVDFVTEKEIPVHDVFVDSTLTNFSPPIVRSPELQMESRFPVKEKPPVSSRFVNRKPSRSSPEVTGVKALRVAKPKKQDTLENTWKMITEGRHVPLTRHLKKSDTWEHQAPPAVDHVQKAETFKDHSSYEEPPAKIRKEPSLGQDELNRRVEAFITKFNEDMRMQRQESLNQYMEMINRGV